MPEFFIKEDLFPNWYRLKRNFDPSLPTHIDASLRPPSPAVAEFMMGPMFYCLTTPIDVEKYRKDNPRTIDIQKPVDVTSYLPISIQKSDILTEVKEEKKNVYGFVGPLVEKWRMEKGKGSTKTKRLVRPTPQVVFLSQICTKHHSFDQGRGYDMRFIADSEIIEEGVYGFSAEEIGNMRTKTGLKHSESLYMITSQDSDEASKTALEFARLYNGMIEEGIAGLLPRKKRNRNRFWKGLKKSGSYFSNSFDVLYALDSLECVHPLIPYSVVGALVKHGEIEAYNSFAHMAMEPIASIQI